MTDRRTDGRTKCRIECIVFLQTGPRTCNICIAYGRLRAYKLRTVVWFIVLSVHTSLVRFGFWVGCTYYIAVRWLYCLCTLLSALCSSCLTWQALYTVSQKTFQAWTEGVAYTAYQSIKEFQSKRWTRKNFWSKACILLWWTLCLQTTVTLSVT